MTATAYKIKPPKEVTFESGPWYGIRDAVQPVASEPRYVTRLWNMWIRDLPNTPYLDSLPGFTSIGTRQGAGSVRYGQRTYQFTRLDGTEYTVGFCGGKVLLYNWATDTWTEPVTAANLTTASITLSTTVRVYCCTFANLLVVSDGVNTPWTWDGTAGAGGLVSLTNAPVFYGQPVIYYAKLFGIKNTERNTLVWSEEGDPTTGYEAGGYNNAWTLGQTEQEGFYALASTDTALTCLRANSITQVQGTVTTDFQSTGTREAVSQKVGTVSPAAVMVYENTIYFLGTDQRFYKIVGSVLSEIGIGARVGLSTCNRAQLDEVVAAPWVDGDMVIFGVPGSGLTTPSEHYHLSTTNDEWAGHGFGWFTTALDAVKDGSGISTLVHWGSTYSWSLEGYAYRHGHVDGTLYDEFHIGAASGGSFREVVTGYLGYDIRTDKQFTAVDLSLLLPSDISVLYMQAQTSTTARTFIEATDPNIGPLTASGAGQWDRDEWDEFLWGGTSQSERHVGIGLRRAGRWLQLLLVQSSSTAVHGSNQRLQIQAITARAHLLDQRLKLT